MGDEQDTQQLISDIEASPKKETDSSKDPDLSGYTPPQTSSPQGQIRSSVQQLTPSFLPQTSNFTQELRPGTHGGIIECPHCKIRVVSRRGYEMGWDSWKLVIGGLLIVNPLFSILPCLISSCKDVISYCPRCNYQLSRKNVKLGYWLIVLVLVGIVEGMILYYTFFS